MKKLLIIVLVALATITNAQEPQTTKTTISEVASAVLVIRTKNGLFEAYKIFTPNMVTNIYRDGNKNDWTIGPKMTDPEFKMLTDMLHTFNSTCIIIDSKTGEQKTVVLRGGRIIDVKPKEDKAHK